MIVIVPCWNGRKWVNNLLGSIRAAGDRLEGVKVVFVDNGSTDGTGEYIKGVIEGITWAEYRHREKNGWWTDVNAEVVAAYPGEDLYFLNNDVEVGPGWLSGRENLAEWGAIGALQVAPADKRMIIFNGGKDDYAGHEVCWEWRLEGQAEIRECLWLTGAALMVSRKAFAAVNGFDIGLKHYCSDSDLTIRIKAAGYKIGVKKSMRVIHYGGQTTQEVVKINPGLMEQGRADQFNLAQKHKIKCGEFDFRDKAKEYTKEIMSESIVYLRNLDASEIEADKLIAAFDLQGKRVLELGCAFGNVLQNLKEKAGCEVIGYENSPDALRRARGFVAEKDITKDWNPGLFDFIFSKAVLEHVQELDIPGVISKIRAHLSPGGITNHNIDTLHGFDPTHKNVKPIEWWKSQFELCGFETVEIKPADGGVYWCTWRKK